jgi:hypothetical protein
MKVLEILLYIIGGILAIILYFIPTIIAYRRDHAYKGIIFAIDLVLGLSGIGYLAALIWALWPEEKSLLDPLLGNPTGLGARNVGDTFGSKKAGEVRGEVQEKDMTIELEKIGKLYKDGNLSREEYDSMKKKIIKESGF